MLPGMGFYKPFEIDWSTVIQSSGICGWTVVTGFVTVADGIIGKRTPHNCIGLLGRTFRRRISQ
jgi:hypothetical protein